VLYSSIRLEEVIALLSCKGAIVDKTARDIYSILLMTIGFGEFMLLLLTPAFSY